MYDYFAIDYCARARSGIYFGAALTTKGYRTVLWDRDGKRVLQTISQPSLTAAIEEARTRCAEVNWRGPRPGLVAHERPVPA